QRHHDTERVPERDRGEQCCYAFVIPFPRTLEVRELNGPVTCLSNEFLEFPGMGFEEHAPVSLSSGAVAVSRKFLAGTHVVSIPYATETWRRMTRIDAGTGRSPASPGNRMPSTTSARKCRALSRTGPGRRSRSPPTGATSARSTCLSRHLAACSSSRSS